METTTLLKEYLDSINVTVDIKKHGYSTTHFTKPDGKPDDERMIYIVTLTNTKRKTSISYPYGQSVNDSFYSVPGKRMYDTEYFKEKFHVPFGKRARPPKDPTIADVLYGVYTEPQSFESFADEFGYNPDSISAKETYDRCMKLSFDLQKIFTTEQIDHIENTILSDY